MVHFNACVYIYAFSRRFLQSIQAIHLYCQYMCSLGIEPTTFALLTQCSTTEPREHACTEYCFCSCSCGGRSVSGLNERTLQADHEDRGPRGSLSGPDPKLPEGRPGRQHQLRCVRAHQVDVRRAVEVRPWRTRTRRESWGFEPWGVETISFCECERGRGCC